MENNKTIFTTPIIDWIDPPLVRRHRIVSRLQMAFFGVCCFIGGFIIGVLVWKN